VAAMTSMLVWSLYDLSVDGADRGSWVARAEGGTLVSWTFVAPGEALPDASWPEWPSPHVVQRPGEARPPRPAPMTALGGLLTLVGVAGVLIGAGDAISRLQSTSASRMPELLLDLLTLVLAGASFRTASVVLGT